MKKKLITRTKLHVYKKYLFINCVVLFFKIENVSLFWELSLISFLHLISFKGTVNVDLTVLSIFFKALTFDHNLTR